MTSAYPIYLNKRLIKVVFIVKAKDFSKEVFRSIFDYNTNKYGGRFNPIIFSDGKDFSKEAWSFLKDFDPDIISFLFKPQKSLLQKVEDRLSPYDVEINSSQHIGFHDQLPTINHPTTDLIQKASVYHHPDKKPFVFFNTKGLTAESLREFIHFNFGTYEEYFLDQMGEKLDAKAIYVIDTPESVNTALLDLGGTYKNFVFPIQLSSVPNQARDIDYDSTSEHFTVIVGDSPYDLLHYWNKSLLIPQWMRPDICHMWLPVEVAEDEKLKEGLQLFFRQRASRTGNNNNKLIHFVSFSLKKERLEKIKDSLGEKTWCARKATVLAQEQIFPNYGQNKDYFNIRPGMDLYQAYSNEETIVLEDPVLPEGVHGGHWMLDLYIQYRPENYQHTNLRHWWRVPNRNHLTRNFFPSRKARIQSNGIPSVVIETKSSFRPDESKLEIKIPEDRQIISSLIFGQNIPIFTGDPRAEVIDRKTYFHTQSSDKGRYLQGIIGLFGGLSQVYYQFREPYWRSIFETLSLSNPSADDAKKTAILNKLKKNLRSIPSSKSERDDELNWLADHILFESKQHGKSGKEETFEFFFKEKIRTVQENLKAQGKTTKLSKERTQHFNEEVLDEVESLVNSGILLMGIKPHCTSCGYANWFHVDDIKQKSECRGCGHVFNIAPETPWLYRLNSLVESGVRQHGLTPVLLTLGELYDDSRSSFIYTSSLDLFKRKGKKWKHLGDLDIVCIQDGKFIFGEIKQSSSLFKKEHFDEALDLAKRIKPNALIFASIDGKKTRVIEDGIKNLQNELEPFGIDVIWHQPHNISYIY
jgi:predicted Zn-ribbon and HTH transcriptional regulator